MKGEEPGHWVNIFRCSSLNQMPTANIQVWAEAVNSSDSMDDHHIPPLKMERLWS